MPFIKRFIAMAKAYPLATAIISHSSSITYEAVLEKATTLAKHIDSMSSESTIGLLMEKSTDYIVSILAIHLLGRTAVPLDSNYPIERLRQMINALGLSICLVNKEHGATVRTMLAKHTHLLDIDESSMSATPGGMIDMSPDTQNEDAPAYVVFTSGTTGQPKPVVVPYRSLTTLVDWMAEPTRQIGTTLLYAAQGFDVSFQEIYCALCYGDSLLVVTDTQKKDLHTLNDLIASKAVTRLFLPTSMLIPFCTFGLHNPTSPLTELKQLIVAGEQLKITAAVRQWFTMHSSCQLINHYGPSETHVVMEHRLNCDPMTWPDFPPIGQVTPGSTAYLLDDKLEPVAPGSTGQLYIAGRSLALGYWGMPEQTAERFVTHPVTQERMYSTGDICILNQQALYDYQGRKDRQYKVRGYRVELKDIEVTAMGCGLIDDCIVVAQQSTPRTALVLYFITQQHEQEVSLRLHTHLSTHLPEYMLPSFYKKIATIPLTQNGKADINKLPQVYNTRPQLSSHFVKPQDKTEEIICTLAASCFGLDHIGIDDHFMEVGANSITLMSLLAELRHALHHDFHQTDLFEYPTPRLLSESYKGLTRVGLSATAQVSASHRKLMSTAIHNAQRRKRGRYAGP